MYDDRPLWEQQKAIDKEPVKGTDSTSKSTVKWWTGNNYERSRTCSPTQYWWEQENPKRLRNELNEIDVARIRQALKGGRNDWSKAVNQDPEFFAASIAKDVPPAAWHMMIEMRNKHA